MNSLKTIFARMTNNKAAIESLSKIGISIKDINGDLKPTSDIMDELAKKWKNLDASSQQDILVNVGSMFHQTRLAGLLNNYEIAEEASKTSAESFGSSAEEQSRYADSLSARLSILSNKFSELAVSAGEKIISDSFIAATDIMGDFLQATTNVVETVGFLPIVLGTAGTAVVLLSKNIRGLATAIIFNNASLAGSGGVVAGFTANMGRAAMATNVLKVALRGLASATIVGAIFVGIGYAIEKYVNHLSEAKQKQKEFDDMVNTSVESWTKNKSQLEGLLDTYKELSEKKESNSLTTTQEEEYLRVSKQLQTLVPSLVQSYDSQGNAILKTGEALNQEIEYTKKLVKQKKELQQLEAKDNIQKAQNKADDLKDKIKDKEKEMDAIYVDPYGTEIQLSDTAKKKIEIEKTALEKDLAESKMKIREELQKSVDSYFTDVEINTSISADVNEVVSDLKVDGKSAEELDAFAEKLSSGMIKMQEAIDNDDEEGFKKAESNVNDLLSSFKTTDGDTAELSTSFNKAQKSASGLGNEVKNQKLIWNENGEAISDNSEEMNTLVDQIQEAQGSFSDLNAIIEERLAAGDIESATNLATRDSYEALKNELTPINKLLQDMAEGKSISATEALELIQNEKDLAEAISIESGMVTVNQAAVEKLRDAKIKASADQTQAIRAEALAQINAINNKIYGYNEEIKAIKTVAEAKIKLAEIEARRLEELSNGNLQIATPMLAEIAKMRESVDSIETIDAISKLASESLEEVGTSAETMSDSTDSASESTENATYVTDKYKQSLEKLNLEMAKLQAIQRKYPTYSKEYQDAVKKEIALTKEQIALNKTQQKDLNAQIKSGNIVQTGKVTKSSSSTSSSSSSSYASGSSTKATVWNFFKDKGFSDSAVAGIMGNIEQESGFNTSAYNSASGATGLAQWLGGRLKGLKNYAKEKGTAWTNLQTQLEWLWKEMTGADATTKSIIDKNGGLSALKGMSVDDAAVLFEKAFERSGGSAMSKRQNYADSIYKEFSGSTKQVVQAIKGFSGTITSTYGTRTRNGKTETHKGVDIAGKKGDAIGATTAGTVTYAGWGKKGTGYGNYGNVVAVTAADGKTYLYAHLDATKVKKGDKVDVNQTIGTMGNTGDSDGVHLHYEVRTGGYGTDINPMDSVQSAKSGSYSSGYSDAADQASAIDDAKSEVNQLQQDQLALQEQLEELNMSLVQSVLDGFDHAMNQYADDLAQIDLVQNMESETSKKWMDQQLKKEKILNKQLDIEKDSIKYLKDQIKNNKDLTEAQKAQLSDDLLQRTQDMISLEQQLLDERLEQADKIIDAYKQSLEAIKDAQVKAIDEMIEAINDEDAAKEYADNLKKAQEERQKILDEIAQYSLDDSYEGKSKLADLNKQLAEKDDEIGDMQDDHAKEERINNLNDQKESIEDEYENLVNDERKFAQMRSDIINANTEQIQKDLDKYYKNIKANSKVMGQALSDNLVDLINQANRYLNGKDYKPIKVAQAEKGALLPDWGGKSGRSMVVHPGELISSKPDTEALFKVSKLAKSLVDGTLNNLTRISLPIPKLPTLSPSANTSSGATYNLSFGDLKVTGDANGAKTVLNEIVKGVKLLGGGI